MFHGVAKEGRIALSIMVFIYSCRKPRVDLVKALVWFWIIDETLVY
jgi:hypothetical protein